MDEKMLHLDLTEAITPIQSFEEANLGKSLYTKPTPAQKYIIPTILAGRDFMTCCQTGLGKTVNIIL